MQIWNQWHKERACGFSQVSFSLISDMLGGRAQCTAQLTWTITLPTVQLHQRCTSTQLPAVSSAAKQKMVMLTTTTNSPTSPAPKSSNCYCHHLPTANSTTKVPAMHFAELSMCPNYHPPPLLPGRSQGRLAVSSGRWPRGQLARSATH